MNKVAVLHRELEHTADRLPAPLTAEEKAARLADMQNVIASGEIEGIEFTPEMRQQLEEFELGEASIQDLIAAYATPVR